MLPLTQHLVGGLLALALFPGFAAAQDLRFFSIGTGGTGATYYPLGGAIANAISNPPGSRPCDEGGSCGVPGLIAISQSSRGSIDNIDGIKSGLFNSGFVQSDVAYWAYTGTGPFTGQTPAEDLRAIAALYPEHIQLIARKDADIGSVRDLRGKRVSLDERGSGSYVNAIEILRAYGLSETDVDVHFLKSAPASDAIIAGDLDAFFITSGYPTNAIIELTSRAPITLVPIDGAEAEAIAEEFGFYSVDTVPAESYSGIYATETLAVGAQWVTSAAVDDDLVYEITKALWNDQTRKLLDVGHAKGTMVTLETALDGIAIPLHLGAERFYREVRTRE
ncbi:TAXI family TRAP transporter solute-binding subunit [Aurantimonas sp. A2-1-M11]|uniref:TAXI family TRAP transporter solute-binding subunit n=1 Tax=Aurantimonas sp. A2-1-M11 TaxID=3113712 RepID=UPI002F94C9C6